MHQTDTACAWLVCHSLEGLCKLYPPYPASPEAQAPIFLGNQSCNPAAWLAKRQLLAGDIEFNPGPKPTLNPFYTHSLDPPHSLNTLIYQSNLPHINFPQPTHRLTHPHLSNPIFPSAKHTHIPQRIYSTAHTYLPQTTYWTSGCLPGWWCLC